MLQQKQVTHQISLAIFVTSIPSSIPNHYISRTSVPALHVATIEKVKKKLNDITYFASTTDMWFSSIVSGLMPYMSYTVHFVDSEWNLQSLSLGTHFLPEDHTATILAEAMESTLLSCFGHNLHLGITKALNQDNRCTRALAVAHKIVSTFSISWKRRRELSKAQQNLNLPEHSLISDCRTRWGSTQKMIERLIEQEQAVRVVLSSDRKASHLVPTWQDTEVWKAINDALVPLVDFTDIMSGKEIICLYLNKIEKIFF